MNLEKNQKHTENGIEKQDTVSPVFWENFDTVEAEKTQINSANKPEEKEKKALILSEEIEEDMEEDIFEEIEEDVADIENDTSIINMENNTVPLCLPDAEKKEENNQNVDENNQDTETPLEEEKKTTPEKIEQNMEKTKLTPPLEVAEATEVTQRLDTIEDKSAF